MELIIKMFDCIHSRSSCLYVWSVYNELITWDWRFYEEFQAVLALWKELCRNAAGRRDGSSYASTMAHEG